MVMQQFELCRLLFPLVDVAAEEEEASSGNTCPLTDDIEIVNGVKCGINHHHTFSVFLFFLYLFLACPGEGRVPSFERSTHPPAQFQADAAGAHSVQVAPAGHPLSQSNPLLLFLWSPHVRNGTFSTAHTRTLIFFGVSLPPASLFQL